MNQWIEIFWQSDYNATSSSGETLVFTLALAFVLAHCIGWVYMATHTALSYSQTFVASLVVLPVLVALMMMLMAGNLAIAFGLLAVFAVVRFRNVLKDTRDTSFVLWGIVEGMAVGTMRYTTAVIGLVMIATILGYLRAASFGSRHRYDAVLTLRLSGDLAGGLQSLKSVLRRHTSRLQLANERKLAEEGLNLSYRLLMRDPSRSDELQLELSAMAELDQISLFLREEESEI